MIDPQIRVLCCCAGGKVRSVGTKYILEDTYGFVNVLACGLEKNGPATLGMLFEWADTIIVVGEKQLADRVPDPYRVKMVHFDIGEDVWGSYRNPQLQNKLRPLVKVLMGT